MGLGRAGEDEIELRLVGSSGRLSDKARGPWPPMMQPLNDRELMALLDGVSRSFVLTIRALPRGLRRPDRHRLPAGPGQRYHCGYGRRARAAAGRAAARILRDGVRQEARRPTWRTPRPRALTGKRGRALFAAKRRPHPRRPGRLAPGRSRGNSRAAGKDHPRPGARSVAVPGSRNHSRAATAAELDEYTYLVAGCVGEFWTRVCAAHLPRYSGWTWTNFAAWAVASARASSS